MRDLITRFLYAVAISAIVLACAVALSKIGIGDATANRFTAGWFSTLLFKSLESRGWF